MDSSTRRVLTSINEYLDDVKGREHMPINTDTVETLQKAADNLSGVGQVVDLSPGQEAAAAAAVGVHEEMILDEDEGRSPGEEAARAALTN